MKKSKTTPIERMLRRKIVDADGCWIWPGSVNKVSDRFGGGNYGQIRDTVNNALLMVHRVSYEHFHGEIPAGAVVDHLCHNADVECIGNGCKHRRCWNPAHLDAKTFAENCAAGLSPGAITRRTGVCKRGHLQTDENVSTWTRASGTVRRQCRLCQNLSQKRRAGERRGNRASV